MAPCFFPSLSKGKDTRRWEKLHFSRSGGDLLRRRFNRSLIAGGMTFSFVVPGINFVAADERIGRGERRMGKRLSQKLQAHDDTRLTG